MHVIHSRIIGKFCESVLQHSQNINLSTWLQTSILWQTAIFDSPIFTTMLTN